MKHVYLSPHLDDAVLSCGGTIHRRTSAGESVLVVTLFAEDASAGACLSSFALDQHRLWGDVSRPMALRRAEDMAALTLLGAEGLYLDFHDAVYRADPTGQWLYPDLAALFGQVHAADPLDPAAIADRLAGLLPLEDEIVLYAPLGVGRHIDHQITHAAAWMLNELDLAPRACRLAFYEDYPYAEQAGALEAVLDSVKAHHPQGRGSSPSAAAEGWRLGVIPLSPADVAAKVSALTYYQSQMSVLFDGIAAMPSRVWVFAATRSADACLAERIWWPE